MSARVGFQTKVLIPVVVCLVLLPVITGMIVTRYVDREERKAGEEDLKTAQRVLELSLNSHLHDLLVECHEVPSEPAMQAVAERVVNAQPSDAAAARSTMRGSLKTFLERFRDDAQVIVYTPPVSGSEPLAVKLPRQGDVGSAGAQAVLSDTEFAGAARSVTDQAMNEGEATGIVTLDDEVYSVAAVAITVGDQALGAVTFGQRLSDSTLQSIKRIAGAEIMITAGNRALATTLPDALAPPARPGEVLLGGVHYLALMGTNGPSAPHRRLNYVLLLSEEDSLSMQADMNRLVSVVSLFGVLLSVVAVWFFTRRSMRPLRDLRDSAEAVGQGDFSRRIESFPNDECGDLAQAFNRMTGNLQSSRAELEKTVATLQGTQAQLVQSEKLSAVGQFVSGVAHELNNPLAAVIGFSELLAMTSADETMRPHLDLIVKSAQRCHKIVQNLLSFARQHPPERKLIGINTVIGEVLDFMAYDFRTSNITIVRQLGEDLPGIQADPHQLQQVFVNILGNARQAIQAARPDGRIVVRTGVGERRVRIEFSDNGPGIRPENLSRIFDPFFTTKPVGKGTGLGLSVSYGIIREHGGEIRAESVPGQGATFVIELPAAVDGTGRVETPRAPVSPARTGGRSGKAVLVVDDEDWLLTLASELLRQEGHEIGLARNGEEAIAALGQRRFDLIVCDWKMPGLSGARFYEHLLAIDPSAANRIMFMSGDVMNEGLREFIARHGKVCLSKPFPVEEFRATVAAQLGVAADFSRSASAPKTT